VALLPKIRLDVVALDDDAETLVEAIAKHARTETIGDGKIWVSTVDSVLRVRTGERDRAAV
jgi:nitrogen regulatory protein P-II 1